MSAANDTAPGTRRRITKIIVDRDLCIGAASCVVLAGKVFQLDAENKAMIVDPNGESDEAILMAARSCPVFAIALFGERSEQLYPEDRSGSQTP